MAEGAVEIEDHLLHVAALGGLLFCDAHVAIADALGHFAWAEIAADELYAFRQEIAHAREDLLKIRDAAAKSAGAEKKDLLAPNEYYTFVTTGVYPLDIPNAPSPPQVPKAAVEMAKETQQGDMSKLVGAT